MSLYIYDPTVADELSRARGVGRYLQILRAALPEATFTASVKQIPTNAAFLNPFFDPIKPPLSLTRIAKRQIAVIHDLIRLKYPHQFPLGLKGKLNVWLNRQALRYYDQIITDSETSKADIHKILKVDTRKISVIYPCLSSTLGETSSLAKVPPKPYVLYVGDATWNKNLVNIARAVKLAEIRCVFVGKTIERTVNKEWDSQYIHPEQQELYQFCREVKDDPLFIFPPSVSDEELTGLYQNAVCNLLLSRDEGFGFSFLEAAHFSTPSILADRPIFHEIAQDSALFVNPEDFGAIAQAIVKLVENNRLREELGKKARARSHDFSLDKMKKELKITLENS
ncbi:glycosyltransferase family 4 protein [Candidatus Roizmanbacteria bacterium]|nr:glycosyltransferase family 4 protein [Candidatus Roizmanbacteria bacterium]